MHQRFYALRLVLIIQQFINGYVKEFCKFCHSGYIRHSFISFPTTDSLEADTHFLRKLHLRHIGGNPVFLNLFSNSG